MKFHATLKVGCIEALFCFKSVIQLIIEYHKDAFALLINLIKTCNSVEYKVISIALERWGLLGNL